MTAQVMFVSAVGTDGTGGTTRLDLSPGNTGGMQIGDSCQFDRPKLSVVSADAAAVDGAPYVSSSYDNRQVTLHVILPRVVSMDARQAALTALYRELDRDVNVLMVRPDGATAPRWLVTYRASSANAWLLLRATATLAEVTVQLDAQPFAFGQQEVVAELGTQISGNAETGTWTATIPPVLGDVETPLTLLAYTDPGAGPAPANQFVFATKTLVYDDVPGITYVRALANPVASNTNAFATATGSAGSTVTRWTPPSSAEAYVFGGTVFGPATDSWAVLGRWRLYARVKRNTTADVFQLRARLRPGTTAGTNTGPALALSPTTFANPSNPGWAYVDLGVMQVPSAGQYTADGFGDPPKATNPAVDIMATRVSGSGTLDIDHILVVPADGRFLAVDVTGLSLSAAAAGVVIDADRNTISSTTSASIGFNVISSGQPPVRWSGGMLRLSPRYPTRLFALADAANPGAVTSVLNLLGAYWPRYLDAQ